MGNLAALLASPAGIGIGISLRLHWDQWFLVHKQWIFHQFAEILQRFQLRNKVARSSISMERKVFKKLIYRGVCISILLFIRFRLLQSISTFFAHPPTPVYSFTPGLCRQIWEFSSTKAGKWPWCQTGQSKVFIYNCISHEKTNHMITRLLPPCKCHDLCYTWSGKSCDLVMEYRAWY